MAVGVDASPAVARDEHELIGIALALGAEHAGQLSDSEREQTKTATRVPDTRVAVFHEAIARGLDPLGEALCKLRSPEARRPLGATYTPKGLVTAMTAWGATRAPARVVDPGAGSGRFIVAAGRALPSAELVAVEIDPVAALLTRAHLAAAGLAGRARVVLEDYRTLTLAAVPGSREGATLFLGNPPYVRHHAIDRAWKAWFRETSRCLGIEASGLAGLHAHFFLATAMHARAGDSGAFVTAAEWLDVNYGGVVRKLLAGPLGGRGVHVIEPTSLPFEDATTTAVVTCFVVGDTAPSIRMSRLTSVSEGTVLEAVTGMEAAREQLARAPRWSLFTRAPTTAAKRHGYVELGEICRVHRGQVTGSNRVWVEGEHSVGLPQAVLFPCVTRARELFDAHASDAGRLRASPLRRVIDLPVKLESLPPDQRDAVDRFLGTARGMGGDSGFIATHRRAWWSVGLRSAAPILATYMARRVPAFVRNPEGVRHLNIAHGLYPREPLSDAQLDALARALTEGTSLDDGRTYAGGLTKFEPREMERLLVPSPALLTALSGQSSAAP